ncbi:hypothetical protein [Pseudolactococcus reticulitermitis]|uniref:Uncharacterized protein n=1 Tax=Pseudolactococcus reticulitermitis TaxID=2025039 RepID=A0A224XAE6_9LACT|nr:hypothetical protein [Lactococcus reticulitermitis]GAX47134.1 hypothetical protein RsY01_716 [Lactococcus reticulitermitis]
MLRLEILNQDQQVVIGKVDHDKLPAPFSVQHETCCTLGIKDYIYQNGDQIRLKTDETGYFMIQLDETLAPSLLYLLKKEWFFKVPLAENLSRSSVETAFQSHRHHLMVRKAYDFEIVQYQNLSFNAHDQKQDSGAFPHAYANVETRDDSVFFAKNAIDGKYANRSHGSYPFASWGINQQADASLTIDFGRWVEIDQIALLFRADFPHDSYWESVTMVLSNGETLLFSTSKSTDFQRLTFPAVKTKWVTLKKLEKAEDTSPFPALTQIEVFGKNRIGE